MTRRWGADPAARAPARAGAGLLLALVLLGAGPAGATPPQIVSVFDTLFAQTGETVLILRRVTDNHGLHAVQQTDTLLVTRDLATGSDLGFRGVDRVIVRRDDRAVTVETLPLTAPANPYAVRADLGAWPLRAPAFPRLEAFLSDTGLEVSARPEVTHRLALPELTARLLDTLIAGRGILPIMVAHGGGDPLDPGAFQPLQDCAAGPVAEPDAPDMSPAPVLARLDCEDADTGQRARLWVVVPPVGG